MVKDISCAYYRLPYSDHYQVITSMREPLLLSSYEEIGCQQGFVIAPFAVTDATPIILIQPESIQKRQLPKDMKASGRDILNDICNKPEESYAQAFASYHDSITSGQFSKLVLARKKAVALPVQDDGWQEEIFLRACLAYPRLMIMLFSTKQTGTWIISSPEILIEGKEATYHTMALAGTMPYSDGYAEWSEKNKREQHVVEQYIENTVTPLCRNVVKDGPYTMRAGNLQHLRTDFRFQMSEPVGKLISKLHPTPAVCGMPKHDAQQFIVTNEGMDRRYYSGFAGPVGINDETHLYVSLRCAELFNSHAELYAGGGIMPDSRCDAEWQETESKMQTIGNVL